MSRTSRHPFRVFLDVEGLTCETSRLASGVGSARASASARVGGLLHQDANRKLLTALPAKLIRPCPE